MPEQHIMASFSPKPGKSHRVQELLVSLCKEVSDKEEYALRYMLTKQVGEETPDFIIFETYKEKAAVDQHLAELHSKQTVKTLMEEGLLAKPPYKAVTEFQAGFDLDRRFQAA